MGSISSQKKPKQPGVCFSLRRWVWVWLYFPHWGCTCGKWRFVGWDTAYPNDQIKTDQNGVSHNHLKQLSKNLEKPCITKGLATCQSLGLIFQKNISTKRALSVLFNLPASNHPLIGKDNLRPLLSGNVQTGSEACNYYMFSRGSL